MKYNKTINTVKPTYQWLNTVKVWDKIENK